MDFVAGEAAGGITAPESNAPARAFDGSTATGPGDERSAHPLLTQKSA
jgi:hypothetical protein